MSRLGAKYQHFFAKGQVWNHLWQGTEINAVDGHASGATVTVTLSNSIVGSASGTASAGAATLIVAANEFGGTAFVGVTAPGGIVDADASLVDGVATGGADAGDKTLAVTASIVGGAAHGSATTPAHGVDVFSTIIKGDVIISSSTPAVLLSSRVQLFIHTVLANGDANAPAGSLPTVLAGLNSGHTSGDAWFTSTLFRPGLSFWPGEAFGGTGDAASGTLFDVGVSLVAGTAHGGAVVQGTTKTVTVSLIPGEASELHIDAEASGAVLIVTVSLEAGTAVGGEEGDGFAIGEIIEVDASISDEGLASGDAVAPPDTRQVLVSIIPGSTGIDVRADGTVLPFTATLIAGQAFGDKAPAPNSIGGVTTSRKIQRVDAVAPGAVITADARIRSGHAFGTYQFAIETRTPSGPPITHGSVVGEIMRKAVVSGAIVAARSEVVGGRASGHASAPGATLEGEFPWDDDEMFLEEFA